MPQTWNPPVEMTTTAPKEAAPQINGAEIRWAVLDRAMHWWMLRPALLDDT